MNILSAYLSMQQSIDKSKECQNLKAYKYLVASIVVIAITLAVDQLLFASLDPNQAKHEALQTISQAQPIDLQPRLAIGNAINLPEPPIAFRVNPVPELKNSSTHKATSINDASADLMPTVSALEQSRAPNKPTDSIEYSRALVANKLKELTELAPNQLQLRFPSSSYKTQQILRYMHQCVGIDIGVLEGQNLMRFTNKIVQQSPLLRVASGMQSMKEKAFMTTYGHGLPLVRIYPYWFDQSLTQHIIGQIGEQALSHLEGEYQLRAQQLWLVSLKVNKQNIQTDWLMANIQLCRESA